MLSTSTALLMIPVVCVWHVINEKSRTCYSLHHFHLEKSETFYMDADWQRLENFGKHRIHIACTYKCGEKFNLIKIRNISLNHGMNPEAMWICAIELDVKWSFLCYTAPICKMQFQRHFLFRKSEAFNQASVWRHWQLVCRDIDLHIVVGFVLKANDFQYAK